MKFLITVPLLLISCIAFSQTNKEERVYAEPVKTELIIPIKKTEFRDIHCKQRKQGGNPKVINGYLQFNGSMDGNRQVDPQIAVGGGFVFHGSNSGLVIYDKEGNFLDGVPQSCFNKGIDPKLFYDLHNKVFGFDLWNPWDEEEKKPVNIAVSETSDPRGAWNIYPVSVPEGVDGGGIGFSKKWIGYSFPGGENKTFIMKMEQAKEGKTASVYHFKGSLGSPVFTQDDIDDLYFFKIDKSNFIITRVTENEKGIPVSELVSKKPHELEHVDYPPKSPQKGTDQLTSSGDRNPKNIILQNGFIWFSQAINYKGNSAVQWHQIKLDGTIIQTGLIKNKRSNYIQTTIGVNKNNDVLIGFQEVNKDMYISPRMAFRYASDKPGTTRDIIRLGEGKGATDGMAWGDYSGTTIDGDNLMDLWTIQSIASPEGRGETIIVKVPFIENSPPDD